jgi:hypothetical protein
MPLNFFKTGQIGLRGVKVLVYGPAGSGKTRLCATAPKPLVLSAEAGLLSLRHMNLDAVEIKTMSDLKEAYKWCSSSTEANKFETFCLDSITEIAEVVLSDAKAVAKDPRQAYGELIDTMQSLIRAFRDLTGKHVYFSAQMEVTKDEMLGRMMYAPSMPGSKLGPKMPFFFDEVFRLGLGRTQQGEQFEYLLTRADLQNEAKDRSGMLDPMEPPNLTAIINKIMSDKPSA